MVTKDLALFVDENFTPLLKNLSTRITISQSWIKNNGLILNSDNTKIIHFSVSFKKTAFPQVLDDGPRLTD